VVSAASPGLRGMTLEQWASLDEDVTGECVNGLLEEEEVPDLAHETVVVWLIATLRGWLASRGGFVFGSEAKFAVTQTRGRKADVTAYFPGRTGLPRRGVVKVPPDIVVEVLSESARDVRRDRIEKPDEYAAFGVHWYWLIDPAARTLEIFELSSERQVVRQLAAASGVVTPPGCEGLAFDLDALWAEIDRLEGD
jgi:Uma2 family endonuclease